MTGIPTRLFLNGQWSEASAGTVPLAQIDPSTEEVFAEVASAGPADVDRAVTGGHRAWEERWRGMKPGARAEILFKIASAIRQNAEELAQLDCRNVGKPIANARDEAQLGARVFEYYAGAVSRVVGETIPVARGGFDFTVREPMGVVAAIVPWNFPFPIACWKVAPALAAGNCVLLKPASQSPLSALRLGELAHAAGLPAGALQVISGSGGRIGDAIVEHPRVRKVSFTGSTEVGRRIMERAAAGLKRVSLELGGKSPNIVFADADIDAAADSSPMSVFANTGQDCCARSRVFVERPVYDRFVARFLEATQRLRVGPAPLDSTQIGPLVSAAQRDVAEQFVQEARAAGRAVALGGTRPSGRGYFMSPAVLLEVEVMDRVWREEVFGPVVCIRPFVDEAEMLREVNDSPYGLSGSIWTNDLRRALRIARRVESGVLSINSHSSVHVEAPFGGFKQSGLGRDLGMSAIESYTELKNIYVGE